MCNPDVPNEVLVFDFDTFTTEDTFVRGMISDTEVALLVSYHALNRLFDYAIRTGIIAPEGPVYYRKNGRLRRYYRG